jgi:hypothetical protein
MEKVNEAKSTCCGKCGHMHVKGTSCPKPFLTGKRHCRNRKNEDIIQGSLIELLDDECCSRNTLNEGPELIKESLISEGLLYHIDNNLPLRENTYRPLSDNYFELFIEARKLYTEGLLKVNEEDAELLESNIGEFGVYNGVTVPLDYIFDINELINEIKYRGKEIKLNKPKRGGAKKFYVYVKDPKSKNIKKVSFGGTTGLNAKLNNPTARSSFAKRHNCAGKKDKTKPGYWACRLPRYAKLLGMKTTFGGFW